jgi:hypothetical protein
MANIAEAINVAKQELSGAKNKALNDVANAKSAILNPPRSIDQQFSDVVTNARKQFDLAIPDPKAIVEERGNIRIHADGSISVIRHDGSILSNVREDRLSEILQLDQQRAIDKEAGVSDNSVIDSGLGLLNTGAKVVGDLVGGAASIALNESSSLTQAVDKHNANIRTSELNDFRYSPNNPQRVESPRNKDLISEDAVTNYKNIMSRLKETDAPLTPTELKYVDSKEFKQLSEIDGEMAADAKITDAISDATKLVQKQLPTSRDDDLATSMAFKRVAETEGTWEAVKHTVLNDWDQLVKQGFESIPYMVAFTIGGPLAQTGILVSLSKSKAIETTDAFMEEHGRDPTKEEQSRIDLWSTVSTVAEKFGDMAALKALPKAFRVRALDINLGISKLVPATVKKVVQKTSLVSKPILGIAGEGLSGAITSAADQIAATGEVGDLDQVAFDALAEALGTPGGVGGIVAANVAVGAVKGTVNSITAESRATSLRETLNAPDSDLSPEERTEAQAEYDALPDRVKPEVVAAKEKAANELKNKQENTTPETPQEEVSPEDVDTSPIEKNEFEATLGNIRSAKPGEELQEAIVNIQVLAKRELTPEQRKQFDVDKKSVIKKIRAESAAFNETSKTDKTKKSKFNSINLNAEVTPQDLEDAKNSIEDTTYLKIQRKVKKLGDSLKKNSNVKSSKNVGDNVRNGVDPRWTGFKTYLDDINAATSKAAGGALTAGHQAIKSTIGKLEIHSTNISEKSAALSEALKVSKSTSKPQYVRGKPGENYDYNNNRVMEYTLITDEAGIAEAAKKYRDPTNSEYIYRISDTPQSLSLVNTVKKEAAYGKAVLEAANAHSDTTFADTNRQSKITSDKLEQQAKDLEEEKSIISQETKSGEDLDVITNLENTTNETTTTESTNTADNTTTTEEEGPLGQDSPPADRPDTDTTPKQAEEISKESAAEEATTKDITPDYDAEIHKEMKQHIINLDANNPIKDNKLLALTKITLPDGLSLTLKKQWDTLTNELKQIDELLDCMNK